MFFDTPWGVPKMGDTEASSDQSQAQEKISQWKARLEELELQLSLGQKEAADFFHEKKEDFKRFIEATKEKIKNMDGIGDEKTELLRQKLDNLKSKFASGREEAEKTIRAEAKIIDETFDSFGEEMNKLKSGADKTVKELGEDVSRVTEDFRTKFDTYRVQLNLATADAKDSLHEKKKELQRKIAAAKQKLSAKTEVAGEKWDEFSKEVSEAYDHIKGGLKKLFS